jgi:SsfX3, N-terminal domain/GDSL-like Lipase/Acylhydrolase family
MAIQVAADDPRLSWRGAVSLERDETSVKPWRIPFRDRLLYQEALRSRAATAAGVRVAFRTDATTIGGTVITDAESAPIDLVIGNELIATRPTAGRDSFRFDRVPEGEKVVELWLPQFGEFRLRGLELDGGASLEPAGDPRPKWVTYGSSITHCRAAASPALTWPADYLSMKVGINIYGAASLSGRTFAPGIIAFVQIVRERHPTAPFVVISPIISPPREAEPNRVGFTLAAMREEVAGAVETLRAHGDRNVYYVDGLSLFGPGLVSLLPDDLHPNAEGYQALGENFLREVAARYFV